MTAQQRSRHPARLWRLPARAAAHPPAQSSVSRSKEELRAELLARAAELFAADEPGTARLLVDAGEDVNAVRERWFGTKMVPLRDAVVHNNKDVVHLLLSRGAKTDWYEQLWRPLAGIPPSNSRKLVAVVLAAGGWRKYTLPPRKDVLVLRELCEKDRAKPSAPFERLFALPKGVFWRVISVWRSHLDEPHAIDDEEYEEVRNSGWKGASIGLVRHLHESSPGEEAVGGLFSDFEPFPVISSRRVGESARAVAAMASS